MQYEWYKALTVLTRLITHYIKSIKKFGSLEGPSSQEFLRTPKS